jgi:C4-dicarboxylate-specific signal transduction histidine kinase
MKLRVAIASVVIAVLVAAATWGAILPLLKLLAGAAEPRLLDAGGIDWERLVPLLVGLSLVASAAAVFLVLYLAVGLPLSRVEDTIDQIASENVTVAVQGGPLVARVARALRRLSAELNEERARSRTQVAELERRNEELLRLQAELVAADRLATVGKLASGVAHEVGNPLSGILGYLTVLRMRAPENPGVAEVVDRIEHEVKRIDQIVRGLLELGRPSRGKAQPLDVRPVIDSCVRLVSAGQDFREVQVTVDAPDSLWLRAESGPLSQVLVNLLINAAQAMNGRGRLVVRACAGDDRGTISVEDEGPGLSEEVRAHLFEPFFTTRPPGQGTGLGLAVSRHLLTQFEGALSAANRPEGGAAFTITLPRP